MKKLYLFICAFIRTMFTIWNLWYNCKV